MALPISRSGSVVARVMHQSPNSLSEAGCKG
jgi:hypothetical protein